MILSTQAGITSSSFISTKITYVGFELGNNPIYPVQRWSSASYPKTYDLNNTEKYGTRGYYQIRPSASTSLYELAIQDNDLGITAASLPTLYSKPSFIDTIKGEAGYFVNSPGFYPLFLGPDGSTVYTQGTLSVVINKGLANSPAGTNASYYSEIFYFTLNTFSKFRIGIATDTVADGTYAPDYVSIYNSKLGTIFSTQINREGISKLVFFDVVGHKDDSFNVGLWQNNGTQSLAASSLITFD